MYIQKVAFCSLDRCGIFQINIMSTKKVRQVRFRGTFSSLRKLIGYDSAKLGIYLLPVIQNSETFTECRSFSLCEFAVHLSSKTKLQSSHQAVILFLLISNAFNARTHIVAIPI